MDYLTSGGAQAMSQIIEAIYQNGVFRPLKPLSPEFHDGETVQIEVTETPAHPDGVNPIMKLAENFYEGLSEEDINEIETVALDRSNFFGDRRS